MLTLALCSQVDVGYNSIGKEQALELISIFKEKDQMTSVGLASCDLGADGAKAVADYVSVSGSLTMLDVRLNRGMGADGKAALQKAVEGRSDFDLLV